MPFAQTHAFCKFLQLFVCLSQNLFSIKSSFSHAARFPTGVKILVARSEMIAAAEAEMLPMKDFKFACSV